MAIALAIASGLALCAVPVRAADDSARAHDVLRQTQGADGVFEEKDGALRHVQSGLVCPLRLSDSTLGHLFVFPSALDIGADVGCDYVRPISGDRYNAKLTLYSTKHAEGETVEALLARYEHEIELTYSDAKQSDTPVVEPAALAGAGLPQALAVEYRFTAQGHKAGSVLIVSEIGAWGIEVRATVPETAGGLSSADMAWAAWKQAVETIGHAKSE